MPPQNILKTNMSPELMVAFRPIVDSTIKTEERKQRLETDNRCL